MNIMSEYEKVITVIHSSTTISANKTYLEIAIEKGNLGIFNLLLLNNKIDANLCSSHCNTLKNGLRNRPMDNDLPI